VIKNYLTKLRAFLFVNTGIRQTIAKNTFWLTVGTTASRIIRAVLVIYAARVLGTAGYGVFSYALSFAAFFSIFSDIGLGGLLTREAVKHPERTKEYLSTTLIIRLCLMVPVVIIMVIAGEYLTKVPAAKPLLPFIVLLLIFDNLRNFGFSITRAENRMEFEAIYTVLSEIFITGLGIFMLFAHPTALGLSAAYAIGSGLGFVSIVIGLRNYARGAFSYFNRSLVKPMLAAAWPFALIGILSGLLINIDTLLVGWFRTAGELGLYAASQRPIQLLYAIPAIISGSLFPIFSRLTQNKDHVRLRELSEKSLSFLLALAFPIMVGGIILGQAIMVLMYGAAYADGTLSFQILLLTMAVAFTSAITSNFIFAHDKQKVFILSTGLGALANIIFDLVLIPTHGINGSAVATLIAMSALNGVLWIAMKKINYFSVLPHMWNVIMATIGMGALTFILQHFGVPVLLNVALSGIFYFGFLRLRKDPLLTETRKLLRI